MEVKGLRKGDSFRVIKERRRKKEEEVANTAIAHLHTDTVQKAVTDSDSVGT